LRERIVETAAALAGGDAEPVPAPLERGEQLADAGEQWNRQALAQVVRAIARGELRILRDGQRRRDVPERIVEPETYHVAGVAVARNRQSEVRARRLERIDDDRGRIGQR